MGAGLVCALTLHPALEAKPKSRPHALKEVLWRDPGEIGHRDLAYGPGGSSGRPRAPFHFVEEEAAGTSPKVKVKDSRGTTWIIKWGPEAYASNFSSHLVWACGYIVETEYFLPSGRILNVHDLKRAAPYVKADGSFIDGRFQLRSKSPKFVKESNWAWTNNPFLGTPEFNGLRILMMLVSNWDAKDARDFADDGSGHGRADSNLAIFEESGKHRPYLYFVSDWGATLGKWSPVPPLRTKWDSKGFAAQTPDFVKGLKNGEVQWGYAGTHGADISKGIHVSDVQWLLQYLGRITDAQIRRGLAASGATAEDVDVFSRAIRDRIQQLQMVARGV